MAKKADSKANKPEEPKFGKLIVIVEDLMQNNSGDLEKLEELKDVLSWLEAKERHHAKRYEKRIEQIEKNPEEKEPKIKAKNMEKKP
jgi:hypothetical protein